MVVEKKGLTADLQLNSQPNVWLLLTSLHDFRIIGDEYKEKNYTGRTYCEEKGIEIYYNSRDHRFSSSGLIKQVKELEQKK